MYYSVTSNYAMNALLTGKKLFLIFNEADANPTSPQAEHAANFMGTAAQVADFIGTTETLFTTRITEFNSYVNEEAADPGMEHEPHDILGRELTGPNYWAVQMRPAVMGTIGGVRTNVQTGQVLNSGGTAIPGLYAAGENANRSFFGNAYAGGMGLLTAAAPGKAAGTHAAQFALE